MFAFMHDCRYMGNEGDVENYINATGDFTVGTQYFTLTLPVLGEGLLTLWITTHARAPVTVIHETLLHREQAPSAKGTVTAGRAFRIIMSLLQRKQPPQ